MQTYDRRQVRDCNGFGDGLEAVMEQLDTMGPGGTPIDFTQEDVVVVLRNRRINELDTNNDPNVNPIVITQDELPSVVAQVYVNGTLTDVARDIPVVTED